MNKQILRFIVIFMILFFIASVLPLKHALAASCPDDPYVTVDTTIEVAGEYAVWLYQRLPESSEASARISVDGGETCSDFSKPSSKNAWTWTSNGSSALILSLTPSTRNIRLYTSGGEAHLSKLLLALDTSCVPIADGSNCIQKPLDFTVKGISQNISDDVVIETVLIDSKSVPVRIEYYFDSSSSAYATQTNEPYCLVLSEGSCASWPSSSLENGNHLLTVRAISESGVTEKSFTFTVNNEQAPSTEQPQQEEPVSTTDENEQVPKPQTPKPTATPNPKPSPSPSPSPPTSPTTNTPQPSPSVSPSPTPQANTAPSQSSSASRASFYSIPQSTQQTDTQPLAEKSTITKTTAQQSPAQNTVKSAVVAGLNLKGEISGRVVVAVPSTIKLATGDKVDLLVNGKVTDTITIIDKTTPTSFSLDTTKIKNGNAVLSVRITKKSGEISTYSSNVTISNGAIAGATGKVKSKWPLYLTLSFIGIALVIGGVFAYRYYRHMRDYSTSHNIYDYTYVQPENPYVGAAGATMAVVFAASAVLFIGGSQSYAANMGYVYDLSKSTISSDFSIEQDTSAGFSYLKTASPDPSPTPTPPAPEPTVPPATTPPSGSPRLFIFGDSLTVGMAANGLMPIFNQAGFTVNTEYTDNNGEYIGTSIRAKGGWKLSNVEAVVDSHEQDLANAEVIVVAIGTNDSPITENYDVRMVSFMNTLKTYSPQAKIFWVNTFFVDDGQWWVVQDGQLLHVTTNPVIAAGVQAGRANGIDVTLIDFEGAINRGEMIPPDGDYVHYSNQGSVQQATWLAGAVKAALGNAQ